MSVARCEPKQDQFLENIKNGEIEVSLIQAVVKEFKPVCSHQSGAAVGPKGRRCGKMWEKTLQTRVSHQEEKKGSHELSNDQR